MGDLPPKLKVFKSQSPASQLIRWLGQDRASNCVSRAALPEVQVHSMLMSKVTPATPCQLGWGVKGGRM